MKPASDHLLSCSRDQTIRIWDAYNGFLLQTLTQHNEWVKRISQNYVVSKWLQLQKMKQLLFEI
jgi:WD40 repeat protein